jgi:hypothetical protein
MKATAALIVVLALVIGVVPQFTDCASQGRNLVMGNGKIVPMKCHWTAIAEIVIAGSLLAVAGMMLVSKAKEAKRYLNIMTIVLGAFSALIATTLIGVCASSDMLCNSVMLPTMILSGLLVMAIGAVSLFNSERTAEQIA